MRVKQLSIFLENKVGRLKEVTNVLSEAGINIRALTLSDTSDFGILRLIVDKSDQAEEALRAQGFTLSTTNVVAVEVNDQPGGLNGILEILQNGGVNVEYVYGFVYKGITAVNIFRFDNTDEAIKTLTNNGITVIEGSKLYEL